MTEQPETFKTAMRQSVPLDCIVMPYTLLHGDCLKLMFDIPDNSVDMVCCDMPYGTTACKWDVVLPLDMLWHHYRRIVKDSGAIVLTACQPFTTALISSNEKMYRHQWVWNKNNSAGFATAKIRPFAICEDVIVFGKNKVAYYPQMEQRGRERTKGGYGSSDNYGITPTQKKSDLYYPKNLLNFSNANQTGKTHPTQKPVELIEYLIKTYTVEGETVLDNCMGSGTAGVACKNLNRNFIGIEKDPKYFEIARNRIEGPNAN